ncbi:hypothetical protein ACWDWT_12380 [Streptomyces sp. NPDC003343]
MSAGTHRLWEVAVVGEAEQAGLGSPQPGVRADPDSGMVGSK